MSRASSDARHSQHSHAIADLQIDPPTDADAGDMDQLEKSEQLKLPTLIVPNTLLLPHMSLPYPVEGSEESAVIDAAVSADRLLLVVAAVDQDDESGFDEISDEEMESELVAAAVGDGSYGLTLDDEEICTIGVIAEVGHKISRPGVPSHVILQGVARGIVHEFSQREPYTEATVVRWDDPADGSLVAQATMANVLDQVESYVEMLPNVPEEVITMVRSVDEPGWLADLIAFSPEFGPALRQELLEILDPVARLQRISALLQERLEFLALRQQIQNEAQAGMDRQQREIMLREQLRHIQRELGELADEDEIASRFREKIETMSMPDDVREKALLQLARLEQQHPFSPEIGIIHTYLDWITELPWDVSSEEQIDIEEAEKILDQDHYGLKKVKERILEFIAVRKLAGAKMRSPILCFVGPPGVGKTSLGKSIARALGREYARMSLGGVRDEAEIRDIAGPTSARCPAG
ncbi:MAG: LON peptidase substrate-binding domain-containing protein [Thermomicrobiales bacterium]